MKRRIVWFALFVIVTSLIVLSRFYYGIQEAHWLEKRQAKQAAEAAAGIVRVDSVQSFNGDSSYSVVTGWNAKGDKLIAWLGDSDVHVEKASAGITAAQAEAGLKQRTPDASVLRVIPGKLNGEYVWELFYNRPDKAGKRYYYDYVKFADGSLLDTYKLSVQ